MKLSKSYLNNIFKKVIGISPRDYSNFKEITDENRPPVSKRLLKDDNPYMDISI